MRLGYKNIKNNIYIFYMSWAVVMLPGHAAFEATG
jgi:hypothetical protein